MSGTTSRLSTTEILNMCHEEDPAPYRKTSFLCPVCCIWNTLPFPPISSAHGRPTVGWVHDNECAPRALQEMAAISQELEESRDRTNDGCRIHPLAVSHRLPLSWLHDHSPMLVLCTKQAEVLHDFCGPISWVVPDGVRPDVLTWLANSFYDIWSGCCKDGGGSERYHQV